MSVSENIRFSSDASVMESGDQVGLSSSLLTA